LKNILSRYDKHFVLEFRHIHRHIIVYIANKLLYKNLKFRKIDILQCTPLKCILDKCITNLTAQLDSGPN